MSRLHPITQLFNRCSSARAISAGVVFICQLLFSIGAYADQVEERRVSISLEVFPRIVAVDEGIQSKLTEANKIRLLIIYDQDAFAAQQIANDMKNLFSNIAGRAVEFVVENAVQAVKEGMRHASAVFIAELLDDNVFSAFLKLAVEQHVLVFSPFAGDVERGATVGISISSRIKPHFNLTTLRLSHINIHEKLLSISQRHE